MSLLTLMCVVDNIYSPTNDSIKSAARNHKRCWPLGETVLIETKAMQERLDPLHLRFIQHCVSLYILRNHVRSSVSRKVPALGVTWLRECCNQVRGV